MTGEHPRSDSRLERAAQLAEARLRRDRALFRQLDHPTLAAMRGVVGSLASSLEALSREARVSGILEETVTRLALADLKPVIHLAFDRIPEAALELTLNWDRMLSAVLSRPERSASSELASFPAVLPAEPGVVRESAANVGEIVQELSATYFLALSERESKARGAARARAIVRRLAVHLDLSQNELGRMLGVSGETVRRWEGAAVQVPTDRMARLVAADAALQRLLDLIDADGLPRVIRRPADLFGGERALDWILRGRIGDVAEAYDLALRYQA